MATAAGSSLQYRDCDMEQGCVTLTREGNSIDMRIDEITPRSLGTAFHVSDTFAFDIKKHIMCHSQ